VRRSAAQGCASLGRAGIVCSWLVGSAGRPGGVGCSATNYVLQHDPLGQPSAPTMSLERPRRYRGVQRCRQQACLHETWTWLEAPATEPAKPLAPQTAARPAATAMPLCPTGAHAARRCCPAAPETRQAPVPQSFVSVGRCNCSGIAWAAMACLWNTHSAWMSGRGAPAGSAAVAARPLAAQRPCPRRRESGWGHSGSELDSSPKWTLCAWPPMVCQLG